MRMGHRIGFYKGLEGEGLGMAYSVSGRIGFRLHGSEVWALLVL